MKFQKFYLNRIKYLILILLTILFIPNVKAIVKPTSNFYVNDYADILSEETEKYIMNRSVALNNVDGTQIVVVTVKNLEGMSLESYSLEVARSFGIGSASKNNGLLILLALEERELRTEIGTGLEGIIPDGKSGRIQDEYMIPYLKNNKWDEGIRNGYDAYYKEIVTLNNLNVDYTEPIEMNSGGIIIFRPGYENYGTEAVVLFYVIPLSGIFFGYLIRTLKKNKALWTLLYFVIWGGLSIFFYYTWILYLFFMFFNMFMFVAARFCSSSGGGYYSGGSSYRSSSYRGGGSSFRGGGGSFGGGGSSRRF